jgi:hypothetical protein
MQLLLAPSCRFAAFKGWLRTARQPVCASQANIRFVPKSGRLLLIKTLF